VGDGSATHIEGFGGREIFWVGWRFRVWVGGRQRQVRGAWAEWFDSFGCRWEIWEYSSGLETQTVAHSSSRVGERVGWVCFCRKPALPYTLHLPASGVCGAWV
jgi:hypothetical protein